MFPPSLGVNCLLWSAEFLEGEVTVLLDGGEGLVKVLTDIDTAEDIFWLLLVTADNIELVGVLIVVCDPFLIWVPDETGEDVAVATVVYNLPTSLIVKSKKSLPYLSISILKVQKGLNTHIKAHVINLYFPRNVHKISYVNKISYIKYNLPTSRKEKRGHLIQKNNNKNALRSVESHLLGDEFCCQRPRCR